MKIFTTLSLAAILLIGTSLPVLAYGNGGGGQGGYGNQSGSYGGNGNGQGGNNWRECNYGNSCIPSITVPFTQLGGSGGNFNFGNSLAINNPEAYAINSDSQLNGNEITALSVECLAYNTYQTSLGTVYNTETNGINGGTVTVEEIATNDTAPGGVSSISPTVIGTVVIPTAPHGGPYVNSVTTSLNNDYVPAAGSTITAYISSHSTTASQYWSNCTVSIAE